MVWTEEAVDRVARNPCCGYSVDSAPASEPTALAAMALLSQGRPEPAAHALNWLAGLQQSDGSVGIDRSNRRPGWPTGWALLAWQNALAGQRLPQTQTKSAPGPSGSGGAKVAAQWVDSARRAAEWLLSIRGRQQARSETFGHDTMLQAWPWVEQTQSWVEPTAMSLLALKRSGYANHARSREAVAMLLDRALPEGGWNYGNTVVLGLTLKPHVQPTGLALAALAGEETATDHVRRSLRYLEQALSERTTTMSLCHALIGGSAHGWRPRSAGAWLEVALRRTFRQDASPYKLALLVLAANERCPWYDRAP